MYIRDGIILIVMHYFLSFFLRLDVIFDKQKRLYIHIPHKLKEKPKCRWDTES